MCATRDLDEHCATRFALSRKMRIASGASARLTKRKKRIISWMKTWQYSDLARWAQAWQRICLKAGFSLTVYNRTAAKAQALVAAGARFAATPAEAVKAHQSSSVCLRTTPRRARVWLGKDGALDGC